MKQLAILRHAKSSWDESGLSDFDRPLNARGRRSAKAVGKELKPRMPEFDAVFASPALRVRQTLERFESTYGGLPTVHFDPALYLADASSLSRFVHKFSDELRRVLLVGHNPGLHQLVLKLARPDDRLREHVKAKYPTGAAAIMEFSVSMWREIKPGEAEIAAVIFPRDLD
jgi:phosphohistidine phosphatase